MNKLKIKQANRELATMALKDIEARDGVIDPKKVVDIARSEESILHRYFEWDDTEAAEQWRVQQARSLIIHVMVEVDESKGRDFFNVKVGEGKNDRGYVSKSVVMSDDQMHRQVLRYAAQQIRHWQSTYNSLTELQDVIDNDKLAEVERSLEEPKKSKKPKRAAQIE